MMQASHTCLERVRMKIGIISVTKSGDEIAAKLSKKLEVDLYSKQLMENFNIKKISKKLMEEYKSVIFITSTGIAVRAIAEYIKGKDKDPAVLVIDSCGKFVISLLSGHLGGANKLTLQVAEILKSLPVITTATDNIGVIAPDIIAKENGLVIDSLKDAKYIAALLVERKKVAFIDFKSEIPVPKGYADNMEKVEGIVYVTHNLVDNIYDEYIKYNSSSGENKILIERKNNDYKPYRNTKENIVTLKLIRKNIIIGIGCKRNFLPKQMKKNVIDLLRELNIDARAVKSISTIEIKKDEQAILELARYLDCELKICSLEEIKKIHYKYEGSDFVEKTIGVRAVCEPCVELVGGKLLTKKIKANGMTMCVGIST